jgi:hypothetical protein
MTLEGFLIGMTYFTLFFLFIFFVSRKHLGDKETKKLK